MVSIGSVSPLIALAMLFTAALLLLWRYRAWLQRIWAVGRREHSTHDKQDNIQTAVCELLEWVEGSHCICSVPFISVGLLQVR